MIKKKEGYTILLITFLVMMIMLTTATTVSFLVSTSQNRATNLRKSNQAYYAAESGIEDALLKLKKTPSMGENSYSFYINNTLVEVNVPASTGITKSITSKATYLGVIKSIKVDCIISNAVGASFYYGIDVGEGGLLTGNNKSEVKGNVFSSGNVSGPGLIDNDVVVSGNGHSISGVHIRGNAMAYSCLPGALIDGNLTYVKGGTHTCTVGGSLFEQQTEILSQPAPIPESQITQWKIDAASGGLITGNKSITNGQSIGPVKITGDLSISGSIILTGAVYVQGSVSFSNNASIRLSSSFGSLGGVLISDGAIIMGNGNNFYGSGQAGSYLLLISTNTADNAIDTGNNINQNIQNPPLVLYTTRGGITISNNSNVAEIRGYKVILGNNAIVQFSSGVVNIYFTSGPGGGWKVVNWKEY